MTTVANDTGAIEPGATAAMERGLPLGELNKRSARHGNRILMAEHVKVLIAEFSDSLTLMTTCFVMSSLSQHSRFRLQESHFRSRNRVFDSTNGKLAAIHHAIGLASTSLRINWTIDRANMGSHIEETFAMLMRMSLPS
jgi:hypothetical protein